MSIVCLIYFSLPNLCFCIIRSLIMFLIVYIRLISECLHQPKLLLIVDTLSFEKLSELLAINYSSYERRNSFISRLLKLSHVLILFQLAWVCTSPQLSRITQSGLAPLGGCQGSCGIVPNGTMLFRHFDRFLHYTSGLEVLACSFDTDFNYVASILPLCPSLNHFVKMCQPLRG